MTRAALALLLLAAACTPVTDVPLAPPPLAQPGPFNGAFEPRLRAEQMELRERLRALAGRDGVAFEAAEVYRLADGARWEDVLAHYDAALTGAGFARSADPAGALGQAAAWARPRRFAPDDAVGVALSPGRDDDPWTFLVVLRTA